MRSDANLQNELILEYKQTRSYGRIALFYDVSKGLIYKIIKYGHIPVDEGIRKNLNLPKLKKVVACIKCGEFHPRKRCSSGNHKKRNRLSINLDNPGSAARSIMKHMDLASIVELVELLMDVRIDRPREG